MKKVHLMLVAICVCISAAAQKEYSAEFMRFYVPNSDGSPFPMPIDAYITISENGKTYIKTHANNPYNAAEFSEHQKYAILKDSNLYLKLDNEDIITLTCAFNTVVKDGFVTTKNNVYQNYADYSYFPIDMMIIEKLRNHEIIKIRGQFKFEIMDGSLQFMPNSKIPKTKDSFRKTEIDVRKRYIEAKSKADNQKALKENPLLGF